MTKDQFKSRLESVSEELKSLYKDNGVPATSFLCVRLHDCRAFLKIAMLYIDDYQEKDEGLDYGK